MSKILNYLYITVISFFLFTLVLIGISDRGSHSASETVEFANQVFTDKVRQQGYITPADYNEYTAFLTASGLKYTVTLEHKKKRYEPIYSDPNQFVTFSGEFVTLYDDYYTQDILSVLFAEDGRPMNDLSRRYRFSLGDLFYVHVETAPSSSDRLRSFFFRSSPTPRIYSTGGLVRDES